jgi:prepilin-type processing-associated H-X9-DG protein
MSLRVHLCPYVEQQAIYDLIKEKRLTGNIYQGWTGDLAVLQNVNYSWLMCPSSGDASEPGLPYDQPLSRANYGPVHGDVYLGLSTTVLPAAFNSATSQTTVISCPRGFFGLKYDYHTFASVSDGSSNTIAFSERLTVRGAVRGAFDGKNPKRGAVGPGAITTTDAAYTLIAATSYTANGARNSFGIMWVEGDPAQNGLSTVLAPNSGAILTNAYGWFSLTAPSSNHTGGVNCAFGDGSVHFITESVNTGTNGSVNIRSYQFTEGESLHGVWGALGSACGNESAALP